MNESGAQSFEKKAPKNCLLVMVAKGAVKSFHHIIILVAHRKQHISFLNRKFPVLKGRSIHPWKSHGLLLYKLFPYNLSLQYVVIYTLLIQSSSRHRSLKDSGPYPVKLLVVFNSNIHIRSATSRTFTSIGSLEATLSRAVVLNLSNAVPI